MYQHPSDYSFNGRDIPAPNDPQVEKLAVRIATAIYQHQAEQGRVAAEIPATDIPTQEAGIARRRIRERRQRDLTFGGGLFGEPAWDILLDLFVAAELGKDITVSSLCIAAATPPTTALRWINVLTDRGIVVREDDPRDQRRVFVRLTPEVEHQMRQLLSTWATG